MRKRLVKVAFLLYIVSTNSFLYAGEYSYKTIVYELPVMGEGDTLSSREETRFAQIIDRHLAIALKLFTKNKDGNGIIDEGTYAGLFSPDGSKVRLLGKGSHPSISALIRGVFIYSTAPLTWTLPHSGTYYLYLTLIENRKNSSVQYGDVICTYDISRRIMSGSILVAIATITDSDIVVNSFPEGKIYVKTVYDLIGEMKNAKHSPALENSQQRNIPQETILEMQQEIANLKFKMENSVSKEEIEIVRKRISEMDRRIKDIEEKYTYSIRELETIKKVLNLSNNQLIERE